MMRFITFSIAGSFVAAVLLMALWPSESRFGAPSRSIAQDNKAVEKTESTSERLVQFSPGTELTIKTEQALKQIGSLNYDETPFAEVMDELSSELGINFFLSSSAKDDSLTVDDTISINLTEIPYSKALSLMLQTNNATYTIDDGVVVIISLDDAEDFRWFRLKMYDCRELVAVLPKKTNTKTTSGFGRGKGRGGAGGGGAFSLPPRLQVPAKKGNAAEPQGAAPDASALLDKKLNQILSLMKSDLEKNLAEETGERTLVHLVRSMVAPDSWEATGQGLGSIDAVNGILVVSQTEKVHQQIDKLLADLEANVLGRTRADAVSSSPTQRRTEAKLKKPKNKPPAAKPSVDPDPFGTLEKEDNGQSDDPIK